MRCLLCILGLGAIFLQGCAANDAEVSATSLPHAVAVFTAKAPQVDGNLGETEWSKAIPFSFPLAADTSVNAQPYPGEIRLLWTKEGLYVAFRGMETTPIFGQIARGEPIYAEDVFEIFIDHMGDSRQFYEIQIDPAAQVYFKNYVLTAPPA